MCGLFGGSTPKTTQVAPTAQQVTKDELSSVDKDAALKERKRAGYSSTVLSKDRTILGNVGNQLKKALGE